MAKFVIFLLFGVALARAAPGLSNHSNSTINIEDETEDQDHQTHLQDNQSNATVNSNGTTVENHHVYINASTLQEEYEKEYKRIKNLQNENIVLVLGNADSGKTVLVSVLTGANLISEEIGAGAGRYRLVDANLIGKSVIHSKTIMTNVLHDEEHNTTYYDLPGADERESHIHFPSMASLRNDSFTYVKSAKVLFVVSYSNVEYGGSRYSMSESLSKAAKLLNDANHYGDAIAMVVNKVSNNYHMKDDEIELISDENVIREVALRLADEKEHLGKLNQIKYIPIEEKAFNEHKIKLIDVLLKHDNSTSGITYERIGILRSPLEAGPINDMELLVKEKENIQHIVNENLKYVSIE